MSFFLLLTSRGSLCNVEARFECCWKKEVFAVFFVLPLFGFMLDFIVFFAFYSSFHWLIISWDLQLKNGSCEFYKC